MTAPAMNAPVYVNDSDQGAKEYFATLMQVLMRNNITARCYDADGRLIKPLHNHFPHIPSWWRSFDR